MVYDARINLCYDANKGSKASIPNIVILEKSYVRAIKSLLVRHFFSMMFFERASQR